MSPGRKFSVARTLTIVVAAAALAFSLRYIATSFRWREIGGILQTVRPGWLLLGGSLATLSYWALRTLRWLALLRRLRVPASFFDLYMATATSVGLAVFTPFQSGELLKVELLRKYGSLGRAAGYGSLALERLIDLLVVVGMGAASVCFGFEVGVRPEQAGGVLAAVVLLGGIGLVLVGRLPGERPGALGALGGQVRACLRDGRTVCAVIALTVCSWIAVATGWRICLYSLGIDLGFARSLGLTAVMALVNVLSFLPGAVGVSEAGIAACLLRLGYAAAPAQAGALIIRFYALLSIVWAVLHFLFWRSARAALPPAKDPVQP